MAAGGLLSPNRPRRTKEIDECPRELLSLGYGGILLGIDSHATPLVETCHLRGRRNDQGGVEVKPQQRQDCDRVTSSGTRVQSSWTADVLCQMIPDR